LRTPPCCPRSTAEEGIENISQPPEAVKAIKASTQELIRSPVTKIIIASSLPLVAEHLVGFINLLELLRGSRFMIMVRMIAKS
jgi:hypothetical protein